jgi:hypothetical protein
MVFTIGAHARSAAALRITRRSLSDRSRSDWQTIQNATDELGAARNEQILRSGRAPGTDCLNSKRSLSGTYRTY